METRAKKVLRTNLEIPCFKADDPHENSQPEIMKKNPYYLGEDLIIYEILSRLPVKSLLKFRCVSKSWYSHLSNTDFIKFHLKRSTDDKSFTHHGMIAAFLNDFWFSKHSTTHFLQCSFRSWIDEPSRFDVNDFTSMDLDFDRGRKNMEIVGTCNGLFCIQKFGPDDPVEQIFLWNPATNNSYRLPRFDSGKQIVSPEQGSSFVCGFGFDESNNDYKVLVFKYYVCFHNHIAPLLRLYSLRTNSWKDVEDFKDRTRCWISCVTMFLNGKLHFSRIGETADTSISCFDLEREEHGLLELPESLNKSSDVHSVRLFEGCLSCVLECNTYDYEMHVWIMRQYGLKESWHLALSISDGLNKIPLCRSHKAPLGEVNKVPICRAEGGEIIFSCHDGFMIYDPKRKSCRNLIWDDAVFLMAHIYVESLVSPVPESLRHRPNWQQ